MSNSELPLPQPDTQSEQRSRALFDRICQQIRDIGPLPFSHFMQMALYEPELGYYMSGAEKFGRDGDFITAPERSPLFARCIANQCAEVLQSVPDACILEIGAGSGALAVELLTALASLDQLPQRYFIYEVSPALRAQQQRRLAQLPASLAQRVLWLESINELQFTGMVLANEVIDALPVERFIMRDTGFMQLYVDCDSATGKFFALEKPCSDAIAQALDAIIISTPVLSEGYCSEICLQTMDWLKQLDFALQAGVMLFFDYGYARHEYYMPERTMGTLMCYYRHLVHSDPLVYPGLQDITAHVDFTAIAEAADQVGLSVAGYVEQADFLMSCGIDKLALQAIDDQDAVTQFEYSQQMKSLLLPNEMGQTFKAMALTKQYNQALMGFADQRDRRHVL